MNNKTNNKMKKFETGKEYGNDLTIKVISRTEKTLTIETNAWGVKRVKIKNYNQNAETISFKAWLIDANDLFDLEESRNNFYSRMEA
jgi:hypothetical protein